MHFKLGKLFRKIFKKKEVCKPESAFEVEKDPIEDEQEHAFDCEVKEDAVKKVDSTTVFFDVAAFEDKPYARDNYLNDLAGDALSRIDNAMGRHFKTTRVKLDMDLLAGSYKGVEGVILENCDYARSVTFKKIKDEVFAIIRIAFDTETNSYVTREELMK